MKAVIMTESEWNGVRKIIRSQYPLSVSTVRSRMRAVLGFTPREHASVNSKGHYKVKIHLDFVNEQYKLGFLLKYSDYLRP